MHGKDGVHTTYPPLFHVGFLVADQESVRATYQRIKIAGYEPPVPAILERGGEPRSASIM
jgi:hypothetical protein